MKTFSCIPTLKTELYQPLSDSPNQAIEFHPQSQEIPPPSEFRSPSPEIHHPFPVIRPPSLDIHKKSTELHHRSLPIQKFLHDLPEQPVENKSLKKRERGAKPKKTVGTVGCKAYSNQRQLLRIEREKVLARDRVLASLTGNIPRPMWKSFQAIWDSANDCDHVDNVKAKFIINQVRIIVGLSSPTLGEIKTK